MTGYIKLHRRIVDWEWYDDANTFRLFMHLLLTVNHSDKKWRGLTVKRGQRIAGRDALAEELNLTPKQIRLSIEKLKNTGEVATQKARGFTFFTVCNYNKYQEKDEPRANEWPEEGPEESPSEGQARANEGPLLKNDKNDKNDKKYKRETRAREKITIDDLSVDHISTWLSEKRALGKYLAHDEHEILEIFKNYCKSKGKRYTDYVAAFRNAFTWDRCQPAFSARQHSQPHASQSTAGYDNRDPATRAADEGERIIAKRKAAREVEAHSMGRDTVKTQPGSAGRTNEAPVPDLREPGNVWRQGADDGVSGSDVSDGIGGIPLLPHQAGFH